ncbi:MAG: DUF4129 domain-containing protein, partial [Paenibacillaceae bacterium]|nr:DUF4129 domain-containing protein [Paenibacillaceae bacterium]
GFVSPIMEAPEESEGAFALDTDTDTEVSAADDNFFSQLDPIVMQRIFVTAVSVLLLWTLYQLRSELYFLWLRLRLGRPLTPGEKAIYETLRLVRRLRHRGFVRGDQETLREAFGRWKLERPQLAEALDPLLLIYEQANYGRNPAAADWRAARELSRRVVKLAGGNGWKQALPVSGKRYLGG